MPPGVFDFVDVVVEREGTRIIDGVTLSVPDGGAITTILGPSGSGKSTLLRLCNRLEIPTSGRVAFRGTPLDDIDPLALRRQVGMVFQRPTVFPGTVRDNLVVARPDATTASMVDALERTRVPVELLDREADLLSGGEAQRVCLARTLLNGPDVLLMDEPTSALDPRASRALESLGRLLADDGMPVLWVTHDAAQAERIADRSIIVVAGRIGDDHELRHFLDGAEADHDHDRDEVDRDRDEEVNDG